LKRVFSAMMTALACKMLCEIPGLPETICHILGLESSDVKLSSAIYLFALLGFVFPRTYIIVFIVYGVLLIPDSYITKILKINSSLNIDSIYGLAIVSLYTLYFASDKLQKLQNMLSDAGYSRHLAVTCMLTFLLIYAISLVLAVVLYRYNVHTPFDPALTVIFALIALSLIFKRK